MQPNNRQTREVQAAYVQGTWQQQWKSGRLPGKIVDKQDETVLKQEFRQKPTASMQMPVANSKVLLAGKVYNNNIGIEKTS